MSVWRYKAVAIAGDTRRVSGQIEADTAYDARVRLRRGGLRPIEIRQANDRGAASSGRVRAMFAPHLRRRNARAKAELLDGVATLLESGVPIAAAIDGLATDRRGREDRRTRILRRLGTAIERGESLSGAAADAPTWFDATEVAEIAAAERGGTLAATLRVMSSRLEQGGALVSKLIGALAYPAVVAAVGAGVVVFLSSSTLPTLVGVLDDAGAATPPLTQAVMAVGQRLAWLAPLAAVAVASVAGAFVIMAKRPARRGQAVRRVPKLYRRIATANACDRLARMLHAGVAPVDALDALAPTAGPLLAGVIHRVTEGVRGGASVAEAVASEPWFEPEFVRIIEASEVSGTLAEGLDRTAARYSRDAQRRIDHLTNLLEPTVILLLAGAIGVVVVAAVLPLTKLHEVL